MSLHHSPYDLISYFVNKGLIPAHEVNGRELVDFKQIPIEHLRAIGFLKPNPERNWFARAFTPEPLRDFIGVLRFGEDEIRFFVYGEEHHRYIWGIMPLVPAIKIILESQDTRKEFRSPE